MATVLLVEDNDDIREMMAVALQLGGNRVIAARHGRDALRILTEQPPPCLILLDLMMPVMDGWELRRILASDPRLSHIPIVVVTAMAEDVVARLGPTPFLPKPIDLDRLLTIVCEHCCE